MKDKRAIILLVVFMAVAVLISGYLYANDTTEENETIVVNTSEEVKSSDYLESYVIDDTGYGTKVTVTVDEAIGTRNIQRNALPNHETGEFPNEGNPNTISEQDLNETYPLNPVFNGSATFARTIGIAINGVKLEPDTAERVTCTSGEVYNIEAIQNLTNLGLDFNNAHVQPTGEYHYHGVSSLLVDLYDKDQDLVHVAFAADGHNIYYSKSGAYSPSYKLGEGQRQGTNCTYTQPGPSGGETIVVDSVKDGSLKSDWDYSAAYGDLDECNGAEINGQYIYLITDTYPYIGRCLNGEFTEAAPEAGNGQQQGPPPTGSSNGPPAGTPPPSR